MGSRKASSEDLFPLVRVYISYLTLLLTGFEAIIVIR